MKDEFLDDAKAHTLAKHKILQEYLKGWLPILAQGQRNRLLYFDGFAGCGELTGEHPGSPVVAIRTAMQTQSTLNVPLVVKLVEKDPDRYRHLLSIVRRERSELADRIQVEDPICAECEEVVTELLDEHAQKPLGPAFFFLDQYGYSGFSMDLVRRILSHRMCETFAYLNWQRMHPYFEDPTKAEAFTRALGGEEWREVQTLSGQRRHQRFKEIYIDSLRSRAKAKYVYDFAMRDVNHQVIYWLFFCTNSLKGLEVMKKAMWDVDPTGRFEFSDQDVGQGMLTSYTSYTPSLLADDLDRVLRGRELTSDELKEHVLTRTPEYRFADAVDILKKRGAVKQHRKAGKNVYHFCTPPPRTPGLFGE